MGLVPRASGQTAAAQAASGQTAAGKAGPAARERPLPLQALDSFFHAQDPGAPGIAFSIERGGKVLYRRAVGKMDMSGDAPLDASTNFRMASLTKQFTAMGILLLAKDGRLSLEDPIRRWLPEMPPGIGSRIRLLHLLTHSSGLIDYESLIPPTQTTQVLDADVLRLLAAGDSTYFPPGTQFRYSNSGFCLLALVIERVSGQPYADFIRDRIFLPLHMDNSTIYREGHPIPHRAMGYRRDSTGAIAPSDQSVTSATKGDGGVYTSLADYARWVRALEENRLLDLPGALRLLNFPIPGQPGSGYAAGWFLLGDKAPRSAHGMYAGTPAPAAIWFHSGSTCGFSNFVIHIPGEDWTLVYFSNLADNDAPFRVLVGLLKQAGVKDFSGVMALHDLTR